MPRNIQLIDINEIKALRITCKKCNAYWSIPIKPKKKFTEKCLYCDARLPDDINQLSLQIENIQSILEGKIKHSLEKWAGSVEFEVDEEKTENELEVDEEKTEN